MDVWIHSHWMSFYFLNPQRPPTGSDTYLKPGTRSTQLPVRSQTQYGSREDRQALRDRQVETVRVTGGQTGAERQTGIDSKGHERTDQ